MKILYYLKCSCGWKANTLIDSKPGSLLSILDFIKILRPGTELDRIKLHMTPAIMTMLETIRKGHVGEEHHVKFTLDIPLTDQDVVRLFSTVFINDEDFNRKED